MAEQTVTRASAETPHTAPSQDGAQKNPFNLSSAASASVNSGLDIANPDLSPGSDRRMICLDAVWELDELARMFPRCLDSEPFQVRLAARAFASRVAQLSGALMDGLSDGMVSTEELARIVLLRAANREG